jgi:hypothetical protein
MKCLRRGTDWALKIKESALRLLKVNYAKDMRPFLSDNIRRKTTKLEDFSHA